MSVLLQEQFLNAMHESWDECDERYSLVGQDGNAFALMGYTAKCMKECGLRDEIKEMQNKAMSGDYNNLIYVCNEYVQRCNDIACGLDESCGKKKSVTESMEEIDRQLFTSLNKEGDGHYYILNDGNYVKDFYANSDEEAKNKFKIWIEKKNVNEACDDKKVDEHLISDRDWDERTDDVVDDYYNGKLTKAEYDKKMARLDKMLEEDANLNESVWDLLKDKLSESQDNSLTEAINPMTVINIVRWLSKHEQLIKDCCEFFQTNENGLLKLPFDKISSWLSNSKILKNINVLKDFCDNFGIKFDFINQYVNEGFDPKLWKELSGTEQYAAENAIDLIRQGAPIEDAVEEGVQMTNWGNAEPEYENEDFYEDEVDYSKVFDFISKYLEEDE